MENTFEIPVTYKGEELSFHAELQRFGYVNKIQVEINRVKILFEQDEEGSYRAFIDTHDAAAHNIDIALIKAIGEVIEQQRS